MLSAGVGVSARIAASRTPRGAAAARPRSKPRSGGSGAIVGGATTGARSGLTVATTGLDAARGGGGEGGGGSATVRKLSIAAYGVAGRRMPSAE